MRNFLIIPILILIFSFKSSNTFDTYCNTRFDFCIEYPHLFKRQPAPTNGDGLIFLSPDKNTEIRAFGRLAVEDLGRLDQEFQISTEDLKLVYKKITKNYFIFSGFTKQGKIAYGKTIRKKIVYMGQTGTYVFQSLMITYPNLQNKLYEPYCRKISTSL